MVLFKGIGISAICIFERTYTILHEVWLHSLLIGINWLTTIILELTYVLKTVNFAVSRNIFPCCITGVSQKIHYFSMVTEDGSDLQHFIGKWRLYMHENFFWWTITHGYSKSPETLRWHNLRPPSCFVDGALTILQF